MEGELWHWELNLELKLNARTFVWILSLGSFLYIHVFFKQIQLSHEITWNDDGKNTRNISGEHLFISHVMSTKRRARSYLQRRRQMPMHTSINSKKITERQREDTQRNQEAFKLVSNTDLHERTDTATMTFCEQTGRNRSTHTIHSWSSWVESLDAAAARVSARSETTFVSALPNTRPRLFGTVPLRVCRRTRGPWSALQVPMGAAVLERNTVTTMNTTTKTTTTRTTRRLKISRDFLASCFLSWATARLHLPWDL